MPIYAYKCTDCGHEQEVLQKISDAPLTDCPDCGRPSMAKQVTAAGFQLKGTGWYVTDFRDNKAAKKPAERDAKANGTKSEDKTDGGKTDSGKTDSGKTDAAKTDGGKTDAAKTDSASDSKANSPAVDKKPAAASSCGGSCTCH
jgi:putative FmdB family regulatory protein